MHCVSNHGAGTPRKSIALRVWRALVHFMERDIVIDATRAIQRALMRELTNGTDRVSLA